MIMFDAITYFTMRANYPLVINSDVMPASVTPFPGGDPKKGRTGSPCVYRAGLGRNNHI